MNKYTVGPSILADDKSEGVNSRIPPLAGLKALFSFKDYFVSIGSRPALSLLYRCPS